MEIRAARPDEASELTELAMRSKAHWGYSDEYLTAFRVDLSFTPELITASRVSVAERDGRLVGLCVVDGDESEGELSHFWVDPPAIGSGVGRRLWAHAVEVARAAGLTSLLIHSDPHAEGFYLTMGAERIGDTPSSSIPGRTIPLLRFAVS